MAYDWNPHIYRMKVKYAGEEPPTVGTLYVWKFWKFTRLVEILRDNLNCSFKVRNVITGNKILFSVHWDNLREADANDIVKARLKNVK